MTRPNNCKQIQELLPLLAADAIQADVAESVRSHLDSCPVCRRMYESELGLYQAAMARIESEALVDMPDGETLSQFVHQPAALSPAERNEISELIDRSEFFRELVEKLRALPSSLDDLVAPSELPFMSSLEESMDGRREDPGIVSLIRQVVWHPAVGYAAAAVILLVALLPGPDRGLEVTSVDAFISSSRRGDASPQQFESGSEEAYVDLKYCIGPESRHQYNVGVREEGSPAWLYYHPDLKDFDPKGCFQRRLLLSRGVYQLVIEDIVDADTITVVREFELTAAGLQD
jgi:hypothetical protein